MEETHVIRRLAAILAADVVGYSRHMGRDEVGTRAAFNELLDGVVAPQAAARHGRIVKTMGDGVLIEFASVVDAVEAAIAIQEETTRRGEALDADRRMELRVGVNLGDVIVEGEDIHGDGVNVAARLEALADPGGICISRAARDQVRDKLDVTLLDLGEVEVKNIARPVRAFKVAVGDAAPPAQSRSHNRAPRLPPRFAAVVAALLIVAAAGAWWLFAGREAASPPVAASERPSVAILPFAPASDSEEARAFSEGVAEDVTRMLASVSTLRVISSNSSAAFAAESTDVREAMERLDVRNVVTGRVRTLGGGGHSVAVELIDASEGVTIWNQSFEAGADGVLTLPEDIARRIATSLARDLDRSQDARRWTDSAEAYFLWRRAVRSLRGRHTRDDLDYARSLAASAVAIDPDFGRAHAAMAYAESQSGYFGVAEDPDAAKRSGLARAERAVELAPDDWYTQETLGYARMNVRDYQGALAAFDAGIELVPSNEGVLVGSALPLLFQGRPAEAQRRLETAARLNPIYEWPTAQFLGMAHYLQGDFDAAVRRLEESQRLNPGFIGNWLWLAAAYGQLGREDDAAAILQKIQERNPEMRIGNVFIKISDPEMMGLFEDGLRKAGLPE